jgi:hypothetical protein
VPDPAQTAPDALSLFVTGSQQGPFRGDGVSRDVQALELLGFTDVVIRPAQTGKLLQQLAIRRRASGYAPQWTLAVINGEALDLRIEVTRADASGLTTRIHVIRVTAAVATRVDHTVGSDGTLLEEVTFAVDSSRVHREGLPGFAA